MKQPLNLNPISVPSPELKFLVEQMYPKPIKSSIKEGVCKYSGEKVLSIFISKRHKSDHHQPFFSNVPVYMKDLRNSETILDPNENHFDLTH